MLATPTSPTLNSSGRKRLLTDTLHNIIIMAGETIAAYCMTAFVQLQSVGTINGICIRQNQVHLENVSLK